MDMAFNSPLSDDLNFICEHVAEHFEEFNGQRLFITGGTGFFGTWLLESFVWLNQNLSLGCSAVVLSRNPERFLNKVPHLANRPELTFLQGDVRDFDFPEGEFRYVIHAAAETSAARYASAPALMMDTIVRGMQRVTEFAVASGCRKFLLTSSGAVYGAQPPEVSHLEEDYRGAPDVLDPASVYGESKRVSELIGAIASSKHEIEVKIARCFAFVGPHLPLNQHFAIGNFIRDGLKGDPIQIGGDGSPYRSYLYAADLAVWLWTILLKGQSLRAYNVGSDQSFSILEIAKAVSMQFYPGPEIRVAIEPKAGQPPSRYVPSIKRASEDLGLLVRVPLDQAIGKTIAWYRSNPAFIG